MKGKVSFYLVITELEPNVENLSGIGTVCEGYLHLLRRKGSAAGRSQHISLALDRYPASDPIGGGGVRLPGGPGVAHYLINRQR